MREYSLIIDGKPYRIELVRHDKGPSFLAKVNDKSYEVALLSEFNHKAPFSIQVDGKPYTVELNKINEKAPFQVKVNNTAFKAELSTTMRKIVSQIPGAPVLTPITKPSRRIMEGRTVNAPMVGKIVSVNVQRGDTVKAGDVLCVLEAMKMENEIKTPNAGVILEVRASEGMAVNKGDVLFILKTDRS